MAERGRSAGRVQGIAETWPSRGTVKTGFAAGFDPWTRSLDRLREWVRAEAGAGRMLPWVPIAFGTGIAFYFAADRDRYSPLPLPLRSDLASRRSCFGGKNSSRLR